MARALKVFVDSDVVISSLLSKSGASHLLLTQKGLALFISNISYKELKLVAKRLQIAESDLVNLVEKRLKKVKLDTNLKAIKTKYKDYTNDQNDAHIVAGAQCAKANFLITYNLRDFKVDKIKTALGIICMTPGQFLQYQRSTR